MLQSNLSRVLTIALLLTLALSWAGSVRGANSRRDASAGGIRTQRQRLCRKPRTVG